MIMPPTVHREKSTAMSRGWYWCAYCVFHYEDGVCGELSSAFSKTRLDALEEFYLLAARLLNVQIGKRSLGKGGAK